MVKLILRRELLDYIVKVSLVGIVASSTTTVDAADRVCVDLKQMDDSQVSMRKSLNYTEMSPDQNKTCSVCEFFQSTSDGCGTCMIFSGPANPKGRCDSWSTKS